MKNTEKQWDNGLKDLLDELRKLKVKFETTTIRIGVVGESGTGKSSLINRIFGEYVAEVGSVEQTNEPTSYKKGNSSGLEFVDLPGTGTEKWPIESYITDLELLDKYDAFILVCRGRVMKNEIILYRELRNSDKQVFVVRNYFDSALEGELGKPKEKQRSSEDLRKLIVEDLRHQLNESSVKVYLTCAQPGKHAFDLDELLTDITDSLGELKQIKFLSESAVLSERSLQKKQEAASKIVSYYAAAAALNGLNPIPGVDVAVDVGVLMAMSKHVIGCYGLNENQLEWTFSGRANRIALIQRLSSKFGQFLLKEYIVKLLMRYAVQESAKTLVKWIPFIGQIIAAGIGYKITISFGNDVIEECHKGALEVVEALRNDIEEDGTIYC